MLFQVCHVFAWPCSGHCSVTSQQQFFT